MNSSRLYGNELKAKRAATSDTATLLDGIPGVSLYGAGGVSSLPAIHGLNDDRVKVVVDGMEITSACGNHMNPPLSYIDPGRVDNVSVIAGVTPVSQGGDSIGGSIVVEPAAPKFSRSGEALLSGGSMSFFYRDNGNSRRASVNAFVAGDSTSVAFSSSYAKSDDYEAAGNFNGKSSATVGSTFFEARNNALSFAAKGSGNLFTLTLGEQRIPYQGFVNQYMDMTRNKADFLNARYVGEFSWGKLEARVHDETTHHAMNILDDKMPGSMPMNTDGRNSGYLIKADISLNAADTLRIGHEYQRFRENDWWPPVDGSMMMGPDTFWNLDNGQRDRRGLFAEWESRISQAWTALLGARYEHVTMNAGSAAPYATTGMMNKPDWGFAAPQFNAADHRHADNNIDLTALARHTPDANSTYEAAYALKTRSPNLYELYAWGMTGMDMRMNGWFGDGNGYVGNLELKHEVADTLSVSASWHDAAQQSWEFKTTPYYTRVHNYIDADRCYALYPGTSTAVGSCTAANIASSGNFVYLQFANHEVRIQGLDLSGHARLGDTSWGRFTGKGVIGYVNGKNLDTADHLYHMMPLNGKFAIEQQLDQWANTLELQIVSAKNDVSLVRNEAATAGYSLVNFRTRYTWKQVRIDAGIENLLNRFYFMPLGGAYLGEKSGRSPVSLVPGTGRAAYLGITLNF